MTRRARLVMSVIINLCMATAMSVTADVLNSSISAHTLLMVLLGFAVGMVLGFIIPFNRISAAACRLCHVKQSSFAGDLVGSIIPAVVNTLIIGAVMTAVNVIPLRVGIAGYLGAWLGIMRYLIPVGYVVALIANPLSVSAGLAVERRIRKKQSSGAACENSEDAPSEPKE